MTASEPVAAGQWSSAGDTAASLVSLLRWRATHGASRIAYVALQDGELELPPVTYAELDQRARAVAAHLQAHTEQGDRVLLVYPGDFEFLVGFLGCLYAGVVAVPLATPTGGRPEKMAERLVAVCRACGPSAVLTSSSLAPLLSQVLSQAKALAPDAADLHLQASDELRDDPVGEWRAPQLDRTTLTHLQFTSGSTSTPRGVMVTHGNLLHNLGYTRDRFQLDERDVYGTWLPSFHDMGLVDGLLQALYSGIPGYFMPTLAFLQRPQRWLQMISKHRITVSGGPNFAFDLCTRKVTGDERASLDLSSWRIAINGSEPVRRATLDRFVEAFGPVGFRRSAFNACYGMAESCLMISASAPESDPTVFRFDAQALREHRAVEASPESSDVVELMGCGHGREDVPILVVDPQTCLPCPEDRVGEIWIGGPSVALGYWNAPEDSARTFGARLADNPGAGPFLRSGDLGCMRGREVIVTGRMKDVIILRGKNFYPQDLEWAVSRAHPSIRPGSIAAFSVEAAGEEQLVIVAEVERRYHSTRRDNTPPPPGATPRKGDRRQRSPDLPGLEATPTDALDAEQVIAQVRKAVAQEFEVRPHTVVLVEAGNVPKTSSGKIQRRLCRTLLLEKRLKVIGASQP